VAINIQNGWIVWVNGPYPAGAYSDSRIAVDCGLLDNLQPGETVVVDRGYKGHDDVFQRPTGQHTALEKMKSESRAQHESINRMFKEWNILKGHFKYPLNKHGIVFGAVANIVQLCIELHVREPFTVHYDDIHV